jgi:hypothetical protein
MKAFIIFIALAGAALGAQAGLPLRAYGHLIAEQGVKLGDQSQQAGARANSPQGEGEGKAAGIGAISGEDTFPGYLAAGEQAAAGGIGGIGREDPRKTGPNF